MYSINSNNYYVTYVSIGDNLLNLYFIIIKQIS